MLNFYNGFAVLFIWIANLIFLIGIIPQIFLNKKIKSTSGLSDLFILGSLSGAFCNLGYTFFISLPVVYKFFNPLYTLLTLIIVFQRFYYSSVLLNKRFSLLFFANIIIVFFMFYNIFFKYHFMGYFLGWVPILISLCKKIPQMFKVYSSKSVRGFSLYFIVICLLGHMFEISGGLVLKLPNAVLFQNLKGLVIYSVFLWQFFLYKEDVKEEKYA